MQILDSLIKLNLKCFKLYSLKDFSCQLKILKLLFQLSQNLEKRYNQNLLIISILESLILTNSFYILKITIKQ